MTRIAIRKLDDTPVSPVGKVIRSADYQLIVECEDAIAAVKQEAQSLYQTTREEAHKVGERQGKEQTAEQLLKTTLEINEYLVGVEQKLVTLVIDAVKKIIGDCDAIESVSGMVGRALYQIRNENRITLQVSSGQAEGVRARIGAITANYRNMGVVDVVSTPAMADGACRLEAAAGTIDTSLERQIALLEKALLEQLDNRSTAA